MDGNGLTGLFAWMDLLCCRDMCWNLQINRVYVCVWLDNDLSERWLYWILSLNSCGCVIACICMKQWNTCRAQGKCMDYSWARLTYVPDKMLLKSIVCFDMMSSLSGGTRKTAATGKPHPRGLRQCKNCQEWQLLKICKHDFKTLNTGFTFVNKEITSDNEHLSK